MNWYAYVGNDSVNMSDHSGMNSEEAYMWSDLFGFKSSTDTTSKLNESVREAMIPSRETVHTVANTTSLALTVAATTTPCTALCTGISIVIDTAVTLNHLNNGDIESAALTMLPGAMPGAVSAAHTVTKTAINIAEASKRGAATTVIINQVVGDTQEYQNKEKDK